MNGQIGQNQNPQLNLTPEQTQELVERLLVDLDAAGEQIVERYAALGLDRVGVAWCLTQTCLSVAVASYFHAGRSADELVAQVREGWRRNKTQRERAAQAAQQGRAGQR